MTHNRKNGVLGEPKAPGPDAGEGAAEAAAEGG
jgi:hypothetical protein